MVQARLSGQSGVQVQAPLQGQSGLLFSQLKAQANRRTGVVGQRAVQDSSQGHKNQYFQLPHPQELVVVERRWFLYHLEV